MLAWREYLVKGLAVKVFEKIDLFSDNSFSPSASENGLFESDDDSVPKAVAEGRFSRARSGQRKRYSLRSAEIGRLR